jgi:hypothetical protein
MTILHTNKSSQAIENLGLSNALVRSLLQPAQRKCSVKLGSSYSALFVFDDLEINSGCQYDESRSQAEVAGASWGICWFAGRKGVRVFVSRPYRILFDAKSQAFRVGVAGADEWDIGVQVINLLEHILGSSYLECLNGSNAKRIWGP